MASNSPIKCYLAGPINHVDDPSRWRDDIIASNNKSNVEFLNPMDLEVDLDDPKEIVHTDLDAIRGCDALLVRWISGVEMAGTPMEMFFAKSMDIPVLTWYEGQKDELSPWVIYFSDDFVSEGSQATTKLQRMV